MNQLQHLLLKVIEESGEISTAIMEDEGFLTAGNVISNGSEINLEINDLVAVLEKLKSSFNYEFNKFHTFSHKEFKKNHQNENLAFWLLYVLKASNSVSKLASKCIQFGLNEKQEGLKSSNTMRLDCALRDLFFGIDCLNEFFNLGFVIDKNHTEMKMAKIDCYMQYSIQLNCVSTDPVPEEQLPKPFQVIADEFNYKPIQLQEGAEASKV